uniref:Uncharacterized protein n=1 Tax=Solanum lycopersicum TaxID=4081 RepID=A0A3Q7EG86_SOLLC
MHRGRESGAEKKRKKGGTELKKNKKERIVAATVGVDMNNKTLKIEYKVEESNKRMISQCKEMRVLATVAENDCHGMIVVEPEDTNVAFVSIDTTWVISDESNKHVEVDQVYKDKSILKAVMERYAIKERFQYKTTRSNSIR